ncbi:hypothetical protein BIU95_00185 [Curtobacterium sp. MCBA15_007]|uniref:ImmA/IrrE family metallo-endopeptidase n=1 Tax=Curtobacterium TaxID=2034 RepID=UPI000360AE54|nr:MULTISPECIES: ImmA/IrrE family metallo-endopeptidase [Curtobacterium]EYT66510.1 hypothetical protein H489_0102855 [Curtobacterium flaccumfaciens UCD-AKU]OII09544.1 hypothetical protein BIU95_00185 [Curtobacterium sp. MCBA15_007]
MLEWERPTSLRREDATEAAGRTAAEAFRTEHQLGVAPIKDVSDLVETTVNADVTIVELPAFVDGLMLVDDVAKATLIAVATSHNPERQRFSIAHELGHKVFGEFTDHTASSDDRDPEARAHAFARNLLLPEAGIPEFFQTTTVRAGSVTERDLSNLVAFFEVSVQVAVLQLLLTSWIDEDTADSWWPTEASYLARRYGWSAERSARVVESSTQRPARRMLDNATEAYVDDLLSIETLAHVDGTTTPELLRADLQAAGVLRRDVTPSPFDLDSLD